MGILVTAMITGVSNKHAAVMTEDQIRAEARKLGMVEGSTVLSESGNELEAQEGAEKEDNKQEEDSSKEEEEEQESEETSQTISENSNVDVTDIEKVDENKAEEEWTVSDNTVTQEEKQDILEEDDVSSGEKEENGSEDDKEDGSEVDENETEVSEIPETVLEETENQTEVTEQTPVTEVAIEVHAGESSMMISTKLEAAGVIESALDFDKYLCAHGYDKVLHTGRHTIRIGASYDEIARILMSKP